MKVGALTSDEARELAAQFCLSATGGTMERVNGSIKILADLLEQVAMAAYEAGECWGCKTDVSINWAKQHERP